MIIGLGEDLVAIDRIEKLINQNSGAFIKKCFTDHEIAAAAGHKSDARVFAYYAKRFAGKEACLKAMGTGMREGLTWHDMQIGNDALGRPVLTVSGGLAQNLKQLSPDARLHITLSDEAGLAHATVIIESGSTA